MVVFQIPPELQNFIANYDQKNYHLWNDEDNDDVKRFRYLIRNHYLSEQRLSCYYCKQYIFSTDGHHWQVEHILPKSLFPQFLFETKNLTVICPRCNREKDNQNPHVNGERACSQRTYPNKSGRFKIIHPLFDTYEDHIKRIPANHCDYPDHYFLIANPESPKGKATVRMCYLDRFTQEFAGFPDMKGKQVSALNNFIEKDINLLTREQKMELIQKIIESI